jgi:hypothetical protein
MSESALERIIERLLDLLELALSKEDRDRIDAVVAGFDIGKEEDE